MQIDITALYYIIFISFVLIISYKFVIPKIENKYEFIYILNIITFHLEDYINYNLFIEQEDYFSYYKYKIWQYVIRKKLISSKKDDGFININNLV